MNILRITVYVTILVAAAIYIGEHIPLVKQLIIAQL